MKNKKVLIVTYYWPPAGGAAVYRVSKFVKYLRKLHWEPIILTVKQPESSQYDYSLLNELPDDLKVIKTRSIEPTLLLKKITGKDLTHTPVGAVMQSSNKGLLSKFLTYIRLNFFVPDAKIGWLPFAVAHGKKIIDHENPSIIFSTSPPPTVHRVAKKLKDWSGLPWVADFRDPWTNIYYYDNFEQSKKALEKNKRYEFETLETADFLTVVNHGFFDESLEKKYGDKIYQISNGFDPDYRPDQQPFRSDSDQFIIRYLGHFKNNQFPIALKEWLVLASKKPDLRKKVRIEFIGYVDDANKDMLSGENINIEIEYKPFVSRQKAMQLMTDADALLLCIGGDQSKKYGLSLKLFDYLLHQKPVIAFGPVDGGAAEILNKTNAGKMFKYDDIENLTLYLELLVSGNFDLSFDSEKANSYSIPVLTQQLVKVFERANPNV